MSVLQEQIAPRFVPHGAAAKLRGVSTRTLDRWIKAGILPSPQRINGRKYHRLDALNVAGSSERAA